MPARHRRRLVHYLIPAALLLAMLCLVVAASTLAPRQEEMTLQGQPVSV